MNTTPHLQAARSVASTLHRDPHNVEALALAEELIAAGRGQELFKSVMDEFSARTSELVPSVMKLLEAIIDTSPQVGAYLMARLYPLASRSRDHATYNAIELWMHGIAASSVAGVLRSLALEGIRPMLRKRYETWAQLIEERSAGAKKC